jgi:DNA-directed RNA polymerase specialized sigma24 family protein
MQNFASAHENGVYGYIKVFTANLSHDHFKASHSLKRGGAAVATSRDCENPIDALQGTASPAGTAERKVLMREVDACLRGMTEGSNCERDRRVFWLYYRVGMTASAIAALPKVGVNVKGVESILQRLTRQVREQLVSAGQERREPKMPKKGIPSAESL